MCGHSIFRNGFGTLWTCFGNSSEISEVAGTLPEISNAHLITLSDEKSETMPFNALKKGFVENKEQSGPFSDVSKTQGKCQLSVKVLAIYQLSVYPIQTLYQKSTNERSKRLRFLIQKQRVCKCCTNHFPCVIVFIIYILRHSSVSPPFYFKSFQNAKICLYTPRNDKENEASAY